jgi:hypothetical protein
MLHPSFHWRVHLCWFCLVNGISWTQRQRAAFCGPKATPRSESLRATSNVNALNPTQRLNPKPPPPLFDRQPWNIDVVFLTLEGNIEWSIFSVRWSSMPIPPLEHLVLQVTCNKCWIDLHFSAGNTSVLRLWKGSNRYSISTNSMEESSTQYAIEFKYNKYVSHQ